jgi:hypothetical protein
MSEAIQIMVGILFLIAVYILTRFGVIWRIRRTSGYIIQDLEKRGAFDVASAVELPYEKTNYFRIGMRDYRPKALQSLLQSGIVLRTESGKYYLSEKVQGYKTDAL